MQTTTKNQTMPVRIADRLVRLRVPISSAVFVGLIFEDIILWTPPVHSWLSLPIGLGEFGAVLVVLGLAVRSWAAGVLPKGKDLATTGPYSLCRHPLYLGSSAMMVGYCMIIGYLHDYLVLLGPIVGIYYLTMRTEESRLQAKYGLRWDNYSARVPTFVPWKPLEYRSAEWSIAQWRKCREYNALIGSLVGLVSLELWHNLGR